MAAIEVDSAEPTEIVEADPDQHRKVVVQNLGPNPIYIEVGDDATVAGGLEVAKEGGTSPLIHLPPGVAISAIAGTAAQSSPADTRLVVT